MVLFTSEGKIARYSSVSDIMEEFYSVRMDAYGRRKDYLMSRLSRDLEILSSKKRFIIAVINETLRIKNVKRKDLVKDLIFQNFIQMKNMPVIKSTKVLPVPEKTEDDLPEDIIPLNSDEVNPKEYHYLLNLPLWSLTFEKVEEIKAQQK